MEKCGGVCDVCGRKAKSSEKFSSFNQMADCASYEQYSYLIKHTECPDCRKLSVGTCIGCLGLFRRKDGDARSLCHRCIPKFNMCAGCNNLRPTASLRFNKTTKSWRCIVCESRVTRNFNKIEATSNTVGVTSPSFIRMPVQRKFGFEIECIPRDGSALSSVVSRNGFALTGDGSVDGCGAEAQTPPLLGDDGWTALMQFLKEIKEIPTVTNPSCGLHMHLETAGMTEWELTKIFTLYYGVQNFLYSMQTSSRRTNRYCARLSDADVENVLYRGIKYYLYPARFVSPTLLKRGHCRIMHRELSSKSHNKRYHFLNMHSHYFRGTIENRMHMNSLNPEDYYHWVVLNGSLIEFAKTSPASVLAVDWGRKNFLSLFPKETAQHIKNRWNLFGIALGGANAKLSRHKEQLELLELRAIKNPENLFEVKIAPIVHRSATDYASRYSRASDNTSRIEV